MNQILKTTVHSMRVSHTIVIHATVFYSRKLFDTHNKVCLEGLFICNQCRKKFDYEGSLSNHEQVHKGTLFICDVEGCEHTSKSKAMHREHIAYGHLDAKTVPCDVCQKMFQTPTNMHSHHSKIHGPVQQSNF